MTDSYYDMSHILDLGKGSGASSSLEDHMQENFVSENDGRSKGSTFFYAGEGSYGSKAKEQQYYRLAKLNDGMYESDRAVQNRKADRERWVRTFCSQCELTRYQTEETLRLVESLNMQRFGPYPTEKIILGVMTIVCEYDYRPLDEEPMFLIIMEDMEVSPKLLKRLREIIRKQL